MRNVDSVRTLHVASWYPNPRDDIEGNFIKAQFDLFREVSHARLLHVQVREDRSCFLAYERVELGDGETGHYLLTRTAPARVQALLTTCLLLFVLLREKAWRFDIFHFHIAWPLLAHAHLWRRFFGKPIIISEHWSAYHYKFHLPDGPALDRMRRPFLNGFPVIAVSRALLLDIRAFVGRGDFRGYVIPNVVPLHGAAPGRAPFPILFTVNRWNAIKDPMPMLQGLSAAAAAGARFQLLIGGFGQMIPEMTAFVASSCLRDRTTFMGKLTKAQIQSQLGASSAYLFSSRYETFSVACAEALGAGVPLVGPDLSAIAEYADAGSWERVETRDSAGWEGAIHRFCARWENDAFDTQAIAASAAASFAPQAIVDAYRAVLSNHFARA